MIAEAMSEVAPVTVADLDDAKYYKLSEYDIVGFGSGIYYGMHDKELLKFVENSLNLISYTFVFSTSGSKNYDKNNSALINLLKSNNKTVLGSFGCPGLDKFFLFKILGGINKGRPNCDDYDSAQNFIVNVLKQYNQLQNNNGVAK